MEPMTPEERLTKIENALHSLTEVQARHDAQIDKHNSAIRDLIVVSRTFLDSQKEVTVQIQKLQDAQQATNEKLHALIDTVDRIIRNQSGQTPGKV
jgi:hypothetical protein